jgi:hypothetical protein
MGESNEKQQCSKIVERRFYLLPSSDILQSKYGYFQTGSEAHPASCPVGTGGPFSGGKARPERDADDSPHIVPRSRMSRSYASSPPAPQ